MYTYKVIYRYINVTHSNHVYQMRRYPAHHPYVGHSLCIWWPGALFPVDDNYVSVVPSQDLPGDFFQPRPITAFQKPMCDEVCGQSWYHVGHDHWIAVFVVQVLAHVPIVACVQTVPRRYLFRSFRELIHRSGGVVMPWAGHRETTILAITLDFHVCNKIKTATM